MLDSCPSCSKVHKKIIDLFSLLSCSQFTFPFSNLFYRQNIFKFAFSHFKFIAIFAVTSSTFSCLFSILFSPNHQYNIPIPTMLSPFPRREVIAVVFYFFFGVWILLPPQAAAALLAVTLMHHSNNHKKGFKEP